jgi:citrate lyase beta subunit
MTRKIITEGDPGVRLVIKETRDDLKKERPPRQPVHVVYGGADRFKAGTVQKLGELALKTMDEYAPDFVALARALALKGSERLPDSGSRLADLVSRLNHDPDAERSSDPEAWLAWAVHSKTVEKLSTGPVEDFRIDFEDGFGFRGDDEEDAHAISAAAEFAEAFKNETLPPFCGFRIKPFSAPTEKRALRTLDLFMRRVLERTENSLPANFVVTLPKVEGKMELRRLVAELKEIEKRHHLPDHSIGLEIMIETPRSLIDKKGRFAPAALVKAADGRCTSAHFGAYDYTADLGVAAEFQSIAHPACDFARQIMLATLSPLGVRLSDSVTTIMPVPIHRGEGLTDDQRAENSDAVHSAWRVHFENVTRSLANGFFQSWDLHPAQMVARYAAVYAFYLSGMKSNAARLRAFSEKATQATLTGNVFDDAASAEGLMNFFRRGLDCRAFTAEEVERETGLSAERIRIAALAELGASAT